MKVGDLVSGGQIRTRAIVMQQKTGRPVQFEVLPHARASLLAWLDQRGGTIGVYFFPKRIDHNGQLSTRQYARLVDEWMIGAGLMRSEYATHSLRRTKASIIYRAIGNLRAVQILLGHSNIENPVLYPEIDVDGAPALVENTEILPSALPRGQPYGAWGIAAVHGGPAERPISPQATARFCDYCLLDKTAIPALAICASSSDLTPDTPTAPTKSPLTTIGTPPSSMAGSPGADSIAVRPLKIMSS